MSPLSHQSSKAPLVCLGCRRRLRPSGLTADNTCPNCGADSFVTLLPSGRIQLWQPSAATAYPWTAGATSLNDQTDHESERGDAATVLICDKLTMLVTGDPVTELDPALNYAARRLREAATNGDDAAAASLVAWIDHRLDERLTFTARDAAISLDPVDVIGRPPGTRAD
jgi:hypothetical protein